MKRMYVCMVMMICLITRLRAQGVESIHLENILSVPIEVTVNETTTLLFPFPITTADWGSNGIIVQQVKAAKNILHLKAARTNFLSTNLSVVTSDGQFYAFTVHYGAAPAQLNFIVKKESTGPLASVRNNALGLQRESEQVHSMGSFLHFSKKVLLTTLQMGGIYMGQNGMWFKLQLANRSWVNFPVGYVRFFLKDRRVLKRRVVKEKELVPIYTDPITQINGKETAEMVYGFVPFTVPTGQRLVVQVGEKGEGRFIELKVPGRKVLGAKRIQ